MNERQTKDPHDVRTPEPATSVQSLKRCQVRAANDNAPGRRSVMVMNLHNIALRPGEIAVIDRLLQDMWSSAANDNAVSNDDLRP